MRVLAGHVGLRFALYHLRFVSRLIPFEALLGTTIGLGLGARDGSEQVFPALDLGRPERLTGWIAWLGLAHLPSR